MTDRLFPDLPDEELTTQKAAAPKEPVASSTPPSSAAKPLTAPGSGGEDLSEKPKLFLLDGMALLYRAHFALVRSPRITSGGLCTSGVFGMTTAVMDLLQKEAPTHIAVVFDTDHPTERHELYPEYKAQRDEMPEDLRNQRPYIDRLFEAFQIPAIRCPGYEADDVIGTLAHQSADREIETWMVTPDKDYDQLVRDHVFIYKPGRKGGQPERFGVPEVLEKWDIDEVSQVIDILALMGDASDNIPGIPGIGPKTAQKLIKHYGSVEALLENTSELKGKQKERVEEFADQARLSKRLVTIPLDVPHGVEIDSLITKPMDEAAMRSLFQELEFDTLGRRLFGKQFSSANNRAQVIREKREDEIQQQLFDSAEAQPVRKLDDVDHTYTAIRDREARQALIERLSATNKFCFDLEATGLDSRSAVPVGLAICDREGEAFYVDCGTDRDQARATLEEFRGLFLDPNIEKIGHNLKYDLSLLRWNGFQVRGTIFDTMLAHSMKEPEMRHGLDYLAKLYLNYEPISIESLIGPKGKDQKSILEVAPEQLVRYACEDADVTWRIAEVIRPDIEKRGVAKVCYDVECPLVPVLVDMEYEGIRLDTEALAAYSKKLEAEIESLRGEIFGLSGKEFNIDSPKQLGVILYEELEVEENPKKTATGQYTTREAELERLSSRHPIIPLILEYRNARKLKSVYVDTLPNAVRESTGHVHTHYSQTWTATGRMQSNDPNLQTIPIRKERGRDIRAAFVPRSDDFQILSADYSQIELRLMAEISGDAAMRKAFINRDDIHTITASKVFKVDTEEVTREMRSKAKTVNFGIIYGISAFGLQQRLNIPRAEAAELIDNYFEKYPGVQKYMDETIEFARDNGYVTTMTGRRRYIREINSSSRTAASTAERLAINSPIQGSAADILKLAMINVHRAIEDARLRSRMVLTVHDEIVLDMHRDESEVVQPLVEAAMLDTLKMTVPIEVEMGVGNNWLEAH